MRSEDHRRGAGRRSLTLALLGGALAAWSAMGGTVAADTMSRLWSPTYRWSAELVRVDPDTKTLTVKSWILGPDDLPLRLQDLVAGEPIVVAWSGAFEHASGIRDVVRRDAASGVGGRFELPAQFVATTTVGPRRYLSFMVRVSDETLDAVAHLEPGAWVTVTARHRPTDQADAIVAIRPSASSGTYAMSRPMSARHTG